MVLTSTKILVSSLCNCINKRHPLQKSLFILMTLFFIALQTVKLSNLFVGTDMTVWMDLIFMVLLISESCLV